MSRTLLLARLCPSVTKKLGSDSSASTPSPPFKSRLAQFWGGGKPQSPSRESSPGSTAAVDASSDAVEDFVTPTRALIREGRVHKRYGRVGATHPRYMALWDGLLCYFEEVAEEPKFTGPLKAALDTMWATERKNESTHAEEIAHVDPQTQRRERMQARLQQAGVIYASNSSTKAGTNALSSSLSTSDHLHLHSTDTTATAQQHRRRGPAARQQPLDQLGAPSPTRIGFFGACCTADALEEGPLRSGAGPLTPDDFQDGSLELTATSNSKSLASVNLTAADAALQAAVSETGQILLQQALLAHHQAIDHGGFLTRQWHQQSRSKEGNENDSPSSLSGTVSAPMDGVVTAGDFSSSRFARRRAKFVRAVQQARAAGSTSSPAITTHFEATLHNQHRQNNSSQFDDDGDIKDGNKSKKLTAFNERAAAINNEGPGVLIRYRLCAMFEPDSFRLSIPVFTATAILGDDGGSNRSSGGGSRLTSSGAALAMDYAFSASCATTTYAPQTEEQERLSRCWEIVVPDRRYVFYADSVEEKLRWSKDICKMLLDRGLGDRISFPDDPTFNTLQYWKRPSSVESVPRPTSNKHQQQQQKPIPLSSQLVDGILFNNKNNSAEDAYSPMASKGESLTPFNNSNIIPTSSSSSPSRNNNNVRAKTTTITVEPSPRASAVPPEESDLDLIAQRCFPSSSIQPPAAAASQQHPSSSLVYPQSTNTADVHRHNPTTTTTLPASIHFKSRLAQQTALRGVAIATINHNNNVATTTAHTTAAASSQNPLQTSLVMESSSMLRSSADPHWAMVGGGNAPGGSGGCGFPSAALPPRTFVQKPQLFSNSATPSTQTPIAEPLCLTPRSNLHNLPPKTPLSLSTPGLLQRRGSFRNSCKPGSLTGVVAGGGTPRLHAHHHHHSRTLSSNPNSSHFAPRTPMSASFAGRSCSFASIPEETIGTPNTASTPPTATNRQQQQQQQQSHAGGGFADERQLFPTIFNTNAATTTTSGGNTSIPPPFSPTENVYDVMEYGGEEDGEDYDYRDVGSKIAMPSFPRQSAATSVLASSLYSRSGGGGIGGSKPLVDQGIVSTDPAAATGGGGGSSLVVQTPPLLLTVPTNNATTTHHITSSNSTSGKFSPGGVGSRRSSIYEHVAAHEEDGGEAHLLNHDHHQQHHHDLFSNTSNNTTTTSHHLPSEIQRRAVLDELAIIDSDSDSDSVGSCYSGGGGTTS